MNTVIDGSMALLIDASIKATLLVLATWVGLFAFRVRSSNVKHRAWCLALAGMLLLPLLVYAAPAVTLPEGLYPNLWRAPIANENVVLANGTTSHGAAIAPLESNQNNRPSLKESTQQSIATRQLHQRPAAASASEQVAVIPMKISQAAAPRELAQEPATRISAAFEGDQLAAVGVGSYVLGTTLMLCRLLIGLIRTRRIVRRANLISEPTIDALLPGSTRVLTSEAVHVPVTVGYWKPVVLLPLDWTTWSDSILAHAVRHEAEHIRRYDTWVALLATFNCALYWFHPCSWIIRRRLTDLAEQVCDDAVIETMGSRTEYARNLLGMAARLSGRSRRIRAVGVAMARKPQVEQRIEAIIDMNRPLARRIGLAGALLLVAIATPLVFLAAGLHPTAQITAAEPSEPATVEAKETDATEDADEPQPAPPVLHGHLVDETGSPVTDATITLTGSRSAPGEGLEHHTAKADENGHYQFEKVNHNDEFRLSITSERWVGITNYRTLPRLQLSPTSALVRDFTLQRACVIRILVINEANEPVPDVRILSASLADERWGNSKSVSTDQSGWATIGGLKPSETDYIFGTMSDQYGFAKLVKKLDDPDEKVAEILLLSKGVDVPGVALGSDGKPAAGWRITAMPDWWHFGTSPRGAEIAADGSFTLPHIVPGKYNVNVSVPTSETMSRQERGLSGVTLPTDGKPLEVRLGVPSPQSMTAISGRIRPVGGTLKEGIFVSARSENGEHSGSASLRSGKQTFRIAPLPPGRYTVRFESTEIEQKIVPNVIAPSDDLDVEVQVTGRPTIRVNVVNSETKSPLPEFRIRVLKVGHLRGPGYVQDSQWRMVVDEAGQFSIDVVGPGIYQVVAAAEGLALARSEPINTDEYDGTPITIELGEGASLSGTVVNEQDQPVDGAKVIPLSYATGASPRGTGNFAGVEGSVETQRGQFTLTHLPLAQETLKVTHPDYCFAMVNEIALEEGSNTIEPIVLKRGGTVEGRVFDASGLPEPNVTLYFQDSTGYSGSGDEEIGRFATAVTDEEGRYEVRHLPEEICYVRRAEEWDSWGVVRHAILPENGRTHTLNLGGETPVTGRLLINGQPLLNAKIQLGGDNPHFGLFKAYAQTDDEGAFTFWGPPLGRWKLYYLVPGRRSDWIEVKDVMVTADSSALRTIDHTTVSLSIDVRISDALAEGLQASLRKYNPIWPTGHSVGTQAARTQAGDPFVFENVPPGTYEIIVHRSDYLALLQQVEVRPAPAQQQVVVQWPDGNATIFGQLNKGDLGTDRAWHPPNLWSKDGRFHKQLYAEGDSFRVEGLPAGDYYLAEKDTRDAPAVIEFSLLPGEEKKLDLTPENYAPQPLKNGFLVLRCFTANGVPLPGCDVTLVGPNGNLTPHSSQNERLSFVGEPGRYQLTVSFPGFQTVSREVTLEPVQPDGKPTGDFEVNMQLQESE